jgi:hypothetical protein
MREFQFFESIIEKKKLFLFLYFIQYFCTTKPNIIFLGIMNLKDAKENTIHI